MNEFEFTRIDHCDHENCSLGQLEYECPQCGRIVITCEGWFESEELEDFRLDCPHHDDQVAVYDKGEWVVKNITETDMEIEP